MTLIVVSQIISTKIYWYIQFIYMGFAFKIITDILLWIISAEAPGEHDNSWLIYLKLDKIQCWIFFFIFTIEKNKCEAGTEMEASGR